MILARVVGTIVATRKDPRLEGAKLLIFKPVSPEGKEEAGYVVAVDTVSAGYRETVISSRLKRAHGGWLQGQTRRLRHRRHRRLALHRRSTRDLAHVSGRVSVASGRPSRIPGFTGQRLLLVQPLTPELKPTGKHLVVTDCTGAGAGELVY